MNLERDLQRCRSAADEGYKLASEKYAEIRETLSEEKQRISAANAEQSRIDRIQNTELIREQEAELRKLEKKYRRYFQLSFTGGQRTTRDVRSYYWNGLKITDVPGVCAFEGKADERLAMEAAKSADLIIFLITNDTPQADEAACLAQLKSLGKPVLGIINVKERY